MSTHVSCSRCGKRVSNEVTTVDGGPLVVRAYTECPECIAAHPATEPHAFGVEVQVNPGSVSAYWRLYDEEDPPPTVEDAEAQRDALIEVGYSPEHLRIVAVTVVTPS